MRKILMTSFFLLASCEAGQGITDPTERGLIYIAYALVISAIINAIFRD